MNRSPTTTPTNNSNHSNHTKHTDTQRRDTQQNRFEQTYGDQQQTKRDDTLRIMTKNLRTIPSEGKDATKYDILRRELIRGDYDFLGLTEINVNSLYRLIIGL